MNERQAAGRYLVEMVESYQPCGDRESLAAGLRSAWTPDCLCLLLSSDDPEVARCAALSVGLIGDARCGPALAELLYSEDEQVVEAAEDALWSIWLKAGGPRARNALLEAAHAIVEGDSDAVLPILSDLIDRYPGYAEAYHQRSQVYYLSGRYEATLRDAQQAFRMNPLHYGALANQGHALAALGRHAEALNIYRQVLRLNPRMAGIRESIECLRGRLAPAEA